MKLNKLQTEQVNVLSEKFEIPKEDVVKHFEKILESKQVQSRDEKARPKIAMRMLMAQLSSKKDRDSFGGKAEPVTIRIEMKEEPTQFKKKDGKKGYRSAVYCTANIKDKDFFTVLTLWNDANEINPNMVIGTVYETQAVVKGNALSMNNPEELKEVPDKMAKMSEVIKDAYSIVEVDALKLNVSDDSNDLKLIKGVISGAWTITTKNDTMMGFLKLINEDGDATMVAKFSRMYEQVDLWDDGSLVYVLGQVTPEVYDEDSGELQYEASAWGNIIVPIDAFEKEIEDENEDEAEDTDVDEDFDFDDEDEDWD